MVREIMDIAFFDAMEMDYNADTPLTQPLCGSQSALCYLAVELARLGHRISLVNRTATPGTYSGVRSFGFTEEGMTRLQASDVVVVQSGATGQLLRDELHVTCPLVLWAQHAPDQPAIQDLQNPQERDTWSGFALPSQWALDRYTQRFGIGPERARIMHNAIAPAFALQETVSPWFENTAAPVLAYTSTPFCGLDVLLDAFPAIRSAIPEVRLRVYSGMSLYGMADANYRVLYERCGQTPGVEYIGLVPQGQLAREMAGFAALAYPCIFPEAFCIAAAEAMSAGALLLTTKLGALPEIFDEFAVMIERGADRQRLVEAYSAHVIAALDAARRDPVGAAARARLISLKPSTPGQSSRRNGRRGWTASLARLQGKARLLAWITPAHGHTG